MERALFIGRFQPPHLGHLNLIEYALDQVDELIILIAAAQVSHTIKNPFTGGERLEMMRAMLDENGIDPKRYWLISAPDLFDNYLWPYHIKKFTPDFEFFFSNNPFTTTLFEHAGIPVKNTPVFKRELYEGRLIRQKIASDKDLGDILHKSVINLIRKWKIAKRIRGLTSTDSATTDKPASDFQ